mmetsp:Transcript_24834/g.63939  ORF Transcript_24834/g.63939 Transcript_24834/m.63939 type:complete len:236 (+) Transcript_24834:151-858(+)|eukprot:jgi/Tetstr1/463191/TSEL_008123.t1
MAARRPVQLAQIRLTSYNSSVYEPSEDSFALVDAMAASIDVITEPPPLMCLEVGCGSGYVICSLALMLAQAGCHPQCFATDLSTAAVTACAETLQAHHIAQVDVLRMDLLSALLPRMRGKVDILAFNPPYVPTPDEEVPRSQWEYDRSGCGVNAAWAGGDKGRLVIDRLLPMVGDLLSPSGHFFMVTVLENDPEEIMKTVSSDTGLHGRIALQQSADEEMLKILQFSRQPFAAAL